MKQALITLSDKTNLDFLATELHELNVKLISTGGTYAYIQKLGLPITSVEEYTNSKEILSGRVKTLHPKIFAGILAINDDNKHIEDLQSLNISSIDLVFVNLYPFEKVISKPNVSINDAIENIDIGGVALIRAAAKNYKYTTVVSHIDDYQTIISKLKQDGLSKELRLKLALKAFRLTASYDNLIFDFLNNYKTF